MKNYRVPKIFKPKFSSTKMRIGRKFDGGYIVSQKALINSKNLVSLGVYDDWSFESEILNKNNKLKVFIFDGSVNLIFWLKYMIKSFYYFLKKKLSFKKLILNLIQFVSFPFFILRKNVKFINKNIIKNSKKINLNKYSSITRVIEDNNLNNIFFKIDIEENEYSILNELVKYRNKIECLVIEFHGIRKNFKKIKKFIKEFKLNITHIHVNNYGPVSISGYPSVVEFTFVKKKYCKKNAKDIHLPIKNLDFPNNPDRDDKKVLFY